MLYAGSRDIPADIIAAHQVFLFAQSNAVKEAGIDVDTTSKEELLEHAFNNKKWQDSHFYTLAIKLSIIR